MARFVILLGGSLAVTARLRRQIAGARIIAADSGMAHADALGIVPELWAGDFDSTDCRLAERFAEVPRLAFPPEKDATDGEIAVREALARGARDIVLVGGLGGQTDHALGVMGAALRLVLTGKCAFVTSGCEEAWPLVPGRLIVDLYSGSRISIIPYVDLHGLDLGGVKWPLEQRDVPLGSSLTLSNVAAGPVSIGLRAGHGMILAYPMDENR